MRDANCEIENDGLSVFLAPRRRGPGEGETCSVDRKKGFGDGQENKLHGNGGTVHRASGPGNQVEKTTTRATATDVLRLEIVRWVSEPGVG